MSENSEAQYPEDLEQALREDILEGIRKLSPSRRKEVMRAAWGKEVPGNAYYNRHYGLQIVDHLKQMIATGDVLFYKKSQYPKWKLGTLHSYVDNGIRYAVNNLDDKEGTLKKHRDNIIITKDPDGVRVHYRSEVLKKLEPIFLKKDDPIAKSSKYDLANLPDVEYDEDENKWRQDLFNWMEGATKGTSWPPKFKEFKVEQEDIDYLMEMFEDNESFGLRVDKTKMTFEVIRLL